MKKISLIAMFLLAALDPNLVSGRQQKTGIVFNRFLLPAVIDTSKRRTEKDPVRLPDADLPKDGTLQPEKNDGLRLKQAAPVPEHKPVKKTGKARPENARFQPEHEL